MMIDERERNSEKPRPLNAESAGERAYDAVVAGCSAGGMEALLQVLEPIPRTFPIPVLVVQHLHVNDEGRFAEHLDSRANLQVLEARDKTCLEPGHVYIAPADYHMLVEREMTVALSVDPKVNWARPSIDVLFESAARVWGRRLIGVILSGANEDGTLGMKRIRDLGGFCIAQDPETAQRPVMPLTPIERGYIDIVLEPGAISQRLLSLTDTASGADRLAPTKNNGENS